MRVTRYSHLRRVADVMSPDVVSVRPADSLARAAGVMRERRVGAVLVLEGEELAGILTERDLLGAMADDVDAGATPCRSYMTGDPIAVGPETSLRDAAELMIGHRLRHLPVVMPGLAPVGVLSIRDLVADSTAVQRARVAMEPW